MPKVKSLKEKGQYVPAQFNMYITEKRLRQNEIAEWLDITQPGVFYKIKNQAFTIREMAVIFDRTKATPEEVMRVIKL